MRTRSIVLLLITLAIFSLACFAYPIYVIRPFRHQGARELSAALFVKQIGPWLSVVCAVLSLAIIVRTWFRIRTRILRSVCVLMALLAVTGAYLARVNVYELMFHPAGAPRFTVASQAHVDADDMVLAVRINSESRSYPIREIAYHHIVNDTIAGEPIVSTY